MNYNKRNVLVYFYTYFVAQLIFVYVNVYLPIYFFNVLDVDRSLLAFIQIFAYSALLIKPVIAIFFDKANSPIKILIFLSSIGISISFICFIFYLNYIIVFGVFLSINFACVSIMDVAIDKIIVDISPDEKAKDRNALFTRLGAFMGALFPNIISIIIFTNIYSISIWNQFFLIGVLATIPLIFMSLLLNEKLNSIKNSENLNEEISISQAKKKNILLLSIFSFLKYSERLYEYPLEPWILNKYGEQYFSLFVLLFIVLIIINTIGLIIAGLVSNRFDRIKILMISSILYGTLMIIAPFTDLITFFIILGFMQLFDGFILINLIALMIDISKKKVLYYQIIATFMIIAAVILVPLGTYLSSFIATELLIVIAGVLTIISIIPLIFLKNYKNK